VSSDLSEAIDLVSSDSDETLSELEEAGRSTALHNALQEMPGTGLSAMQFSGCLKLVSECGWSVPKPVRTSRDLDVLNNHLKICEQASPAPKRFIVSIDVGSTHFAFCIVDRQTSHVTEWDSLDLSQLENGMPSVLRGCHQTGMRLKQWLNQVESRYGNDYSVVIEGQYIAPRNNYNKHLLSNMMIESQVAALFAGHCESLTSNLVSSFIKRIYPDHTVANSSSYNYKSKKSSAVNLVLAILKTGSFAGESFTVSTGLEESFLSCKKKDDLSDCLLQALSYNCFLKKRACLPLALK